MPFGGDVGGREPDPVQAIPRANDVGADDEVVPDEVDRQHRGQVDQEDDRPQHEGQQLGPIPARHPGSATVDRRAPRAAAGARDVRPSSRLTAFAHRRITLARGLERG